MKVKDISTRTEEKLIIYVGSDTYECQNNAMVKQKGLHHTIKIDVREKNMVLEQEVVNISVQANRMNTTIHIQTKVSNFKNSEVEDF